MALPQDYRKERNSSDFWEEASLHMYHPDAAGSVHFPTESEGMIALDAECLSSGGDDDDSATSLESGSDSDIETQKSTDGKRLSRAKAKKARKAETTKKHSKGPTKPMREIGKTMDHILWDDRFKETEWLVGYEDRHNARMLEKPLIDWKSKGGSVKDVTDEEFIPQSRIQYLRRDSSEEKYWDRATRTDRIEDWANNATRADDC